jgi:hypothetical protein
MVLPTGHAVQFTAEFTPTLSPGVTTTPAFTIRLRSSNASEVLQAGSVIVTGGATLSSVDAAGSNVNVLLTGPAPYSFAIKAAFAYSS